MAGTAPTPGDAASKLDTLYDGFKKEFRNVPEVTALELHDWMNKAKASDALAPVLVDVRTPAEQQVSVLPGAGTVTQREFEERGPEAFRGRRVVCYCTAGYRSGLLASKARRNHGLDTYNLRGGILAWTQAGYPLSEPQDGAPTTRVHVFSKDWALQGEGYEPVMFQRPLVPLVRDAVGGLVRSGLRMLRLGGGRAKAGAGARGAEEAPGQGE